MAVMNLLKANFEGTVGAVTGSKTKRGNVVKSRIWSKTPANVKQSTSVRSFEALNRLSSALGKHFWQYLGLKKGDMLKHNKIAQFLKPLIADKTFDLKKLETIFSKDKSVTILNATYDATKSVLEVEVKSNIQPTTSGNFQWCIILIKNNGKVELIQNPKTDYFKTSLVLENVAIEGINILTLATSDKQRGKFYRGFSLETIPALYYIDTTLNVNAFPRRNNFSFNKNTFIVAKTSGIYEDDTLSLFTI